MCFVPRVVPSRQGPVLPWVTYKPTKVMREVPVRPRVPGSLRSILTSLVRSERTETWVPHVRPSVLRVQSATGGRAQRVVTSLPCRCHVGLGARRTHEVPCSSGTSRQRLWSDVQEVGLTVPTRVSFSRPRRDPRDEISRGGPWTVSSRNREVPFGSTWGPFVRRGRTSREVGRPGGPEGASGRAKRSRLGARKTIRCHGGPPVGRVVGGPFPRDLGSGDAP